MKHPVHTGKRAEQAAADYLAAEGYRILEQNYRRPHCEIDIVASKQKTIYFVEVKYRATNAWGSGFDYITTQKLQHMQRAAVSWIRDRRHNGEYTLAAIEVGGPDYEIQNFIESVY